MFQLLTIRQQGLLALLLFYGLVLALPLPATAQFAPEREQRSAQTPRGALWRAAVLPGWGQFYNRQYWKLPLVYLGFSGLGGTAFYMNSRYLLYRHAYLFTARTDAGGAPVFPEYADDYARLLDDLGLPPESGLSPEEIASRRNRLEPTFRSDRDNLRRNRDLLYIGFGLWYGLTLLDAYVSAHLHDFDIDEDLSIGIAPHPDGLAASIRLTF